MSVHNLRCEVMKPGDVRIDRRSPFGNPFWMRDESDEERARVIREFRAHLWKRLKRDPEFRRSIKALHGRRLFCWCHPLPCHGDIILRAAAWLNFSRGRSGGCGMGRRC